MVDFYERYQQGFYQEVYNDLLAMQEQILDRGVYPDAILVAKALMHRVHLNIEKLIPRLNILDYTFVDGYLNKQFLHRSSKEEQEKLNQMYRTFRLPPFDTPYQLQIVERQLGTFPLSLRYWYEGVGSVNLVGTFPMTKMPRERAVLLDPLFIEPLASFLQWPPEEEEGSVEIDLSPDNGFKYGYSSGGSYVMRIPCVAFDANFELERQTMTFVNYLRICFQWGGFFGLYEAKDNDRLKQEERTISQEELAFLTKDLLPF